MSTNVCYEFFNVLVDEIIIYYNVYINVHIKFIVCVVNWIVSLKEKLKFWLCVPMNITLFGNEPLQYNVDTLFPRGF